MIDVHLSFFLQNVIGRCSQPLVGPNGRRSREDEKLMTAFNVKILPSSIPVLKQLQQQCTFARSGGPGCTALALVYVGPDPIGNA